MTPPRTAPIQATDSMRLDAPAAAIWQVLTDFQAYSKWYPRRVGMSVVHAVPAGIGTELQFRPLGGRSFRCRVEELEAPHRILIRYHGDFITGTGTWLLEGERAHTRATYRIDVIAHGVLVVLLARWLDLGKIHSGQMRVVLRDLGAEVRRRAVEAAGPRGSRARRSAHP